MDKGWGRLEEREILQLILIAAHVTIEIKLKY